MSSNNKYRHNMLVGPSSEKPAKFGVNGANRNEQDDDATLDFSEIWLTLRRGKWLILLTCLIVTGAVAGYTYVQEPEYESESLVMIDRGQGARGAFMGFGGDEEGQGLANEIGKLQYSGDLMQRVVNRLVETADAMDEASARQFFPVLYEEGERLEAAEVSLFVRERMEFEAMGQQSIIVIRAWSPVPEEASRLANVYMEEYRAYAQETSRAGAVAAREFLEKQVERRGERLDEIDDQLVRFQLEQDFATRGATGERVLEEYSQLRERLENLEADKVQQEFQLERLQEELRNIEPDMDSRIADGIEMERLRTEMNELSRQVAVLEQQAEEFYMNDPSLRGNEEQVEELAMIVRRADRLRERRDEKITQLVQQFGGSRFAGGEEGQMGYAAELRTRIIEIEGNVMGLNAQIETVENRLAEAQPDVQGVPRQQIEFEQLQRERNIVAEQHSNYMARLHDTMMSEQADLGYVEPVQQARVPEVPVRPNMQQNIILGILLGLGFGVGLAFMWRASAGRIEKPEDLQLNGYSVVGVVPAMRREIKSSFGGSNTVEVDGQRVDTHLMTLLNPWSPIAENYRLIRTNIQSNRGQVPPVMLVTSPEMGDGKTVTTCNLAIALARNGLRTLLIDADLRRPNAHALLGTDLSPGLGERLQSTAVHDDFSGLETMVEHLSFLPAGTNENPPAELLGTQHMESVLTAAREQFDAVLIDSPPVLAVTDSVVLSRTVDATFIVVSADRTELAALHTTRDTLEAVGSGVSGVILNRFDEKKSSYQYGYGYGYGRTEAYNKARVTA
jgi:polysaccharide biosynthesis transport protein